MPALPETPAGSGITPQQVRDVARLSRLRVDDATLPRLTAQLESILHYVAKVGEVDVTGVEPMAHALQLKNVLREDVAEPALPTEKVLRNAPETDGPFFKVPKVLGGDEDSAG
jgi:aspartyl-tRNA(Asn)/glutamyl-tRNA(Gln) amidotransferase subunit C